jgi:hypothetical protein
MKEINHGRPYIVSRAVEEPIEATFEQGNEIKKIYTKLRLPVILGGLGNLFILLFLLPSLYSLVILIISLSAGNIEPSNELILTVFGFGLVIVLLLSVIITCSIYLTAISRFNSHLYQRSTVLSGLQEAGSSPEAMKLKSSRKNGADGKLSARDEDSIRKITAEKKHMRNPIFATLDLIEESMHELPQIIKLIKYSRFIIWLIILFASITLLSKSIFFQNLPLELNWIELVFGIIGLALFIPLSNALTDSKNFFEYLSVRHNIIDNIRFRKDISVPSGKDQLERLKKYLLNNDPYIQKSAVADSRSFKMNKEIKGGSGKRYIFDAYFNGENIPRTGETTIEVPRGKFACFIKVFNHDLSIAALIRFREEVSDVCSGSSTFPLRIIALQSSIAELPEDVYNYVLENPIIMKNCMTHLEIIAEDGDVYSFIPMLAYANEGKSVLNH